MKLKAVEIDTLGGYKTVIWDEDEKQANIAAQDLLDTVNTPQYIIGCEYIRKNYGRVVNAKIVKQLLEQHGHIEVTTATAHMVSDTNNGSCRAVTKGLKAAEVSISNNAILIGKLT